MRSSQGSSQRQGLRHRTLHEREPANVAVVTAVVAEDDDSDANNNDSQQHQQQQQLARRSRKTARMTFTNSRHRRQGRHPHASTESEDQQDDDDDDEMADEKEEGEEEEGRQHDQEADYYEHEEDASRRAHGDRWPGERPITGQNFAATDGVYARYNNASTLRRRRGSNSHTIHRYTSPIPQQTHQAIPVTASALSTDTAITESSGDNTGAGAIHLNDGDDSEHVVETNHPRRKYSREHRQQQQERAQRVKYGSSSNNGKGRGRASKGNEPKTFEGMDSYLYLDQRTKEILTSMTAKNRGQQHHRSGPHSQYQNLPQSHETSDITTSAAAPAVADELSESGTELEGEGDSDGHEEISARYMNYQHNEHSEGYYDSSFLSASGALRAGMNTANNNNSNSKSQRPSRQYSRDYHSHHHPQPQRHRTIDIAGNDGANSLSDSGGMPLSEADDDSGDGSDGDSAPSDVFVDKGGYQHRNRRSPSITTGQIPGDASVLDSMQDQVEHIYERLETSKVEQQRLQQWILERSHYEEDLRNQWIESKKQMEYMLVQLQQMFDQQRVQTELLRKDFLEPLQLLQQQSHSRVFDSGAKSQLSLPVVEEGDGGMEFHLQESLELEKEDGRSMVSIPLAVSSSNLSKEEIRLRHLEYKRYSHPIQYHSQREDTTRMQERKRELERTENEGPIVDDPDITSPTERSSSEVSIYRTQDQDTTNTKDTTTAKGAVSLIIAYPLMFLTHFIKVWMYNPIRWLFKVCFWMLVLMILQVWVIDLFFLPPTTRAPIATNMPTSPSSSSTHQLVNVAHYKNRDYIADQPGYYTVANDGFGTETLAYCHDLARLEYLEQDLAYLQMHRKTWAAIVMSGIRKAQQQTIHWLWTHGVTAAEKLGIGRVEQWLVDRLVESRKQRRRGQPKVKAAMITGKSDSQPTEGLRDTHQQPSPVQQPSIQSP